MTRLRRLAIVLTALAASLPPLSVVRADNEFPNRYVDGDNAPRPEPAPRVYVGHEGVLSDGPNCGVVSHPIDDSSIWLGHFSGGNVGPQGPVPGGVDWHDIYACFPTRETCKAWQRDMRAEFRDLEGWRSCLVIR